MRWAGYFCSKCNKYRSLRQVFSEEKGISSVYCKKCKGIVTFINILL